MSATASEQTWEAFRQHRHKTEKKLLAARAATRSSEISRTKCGNGKHAQSQMTAAEQRRSIPLELLAREWLNQQDAGPETKAYLVERLLPTLIMGLETLLTKVSRYLDIARVDFDFSQHNDRAVRMHVPPVTFKKIRSS